MIYVKFFDFIFALLKSQKGYQSVYLCLIMLNGCLFLLYKTTVTLVIEPSKSSAVTSVWWFYMIIFHLCINYLFVFVSVYILISIKIKREEYLKK